MDTLRKQRLWELQQAFDIEEEFGEMPVWTVLAESLADDLNRKHARQVVVPRDRKR